MSRFASALFPLSLLALLHAGCSSEIDGKTAAQVREVPAAPAPPAPPAPSAPPAAATDMAATPDAGVELPFSSDSSSLEWVGAKVTRDHKGGFRSFQGTARVDGDQVLGAKVVIDMLSIYSDTEKLTGHLQSPDFFDVAKYSNATFETRSIVAGGTGGTHTVTGELEMVGQKKELSFPATISAGPDGIAVKAEFTLNRQLWGIAYPGKPDDLIKDEVLVRFDVKLPKAG